MTDRAPRALDLVTVVFRAELRLLNLQARSVARFFASDAINRILVIVNDFREDDCAAEVAAIRPSMGRFADRVDIVRPEALLGEPALAPVQRLERWWVAGPGERSCAGCRDGSDWPAAGGATRLVHAAGAEAAGGQYSQRVAPTRSRCEELPRRPGRRGDLRRGRWPGRSRRIRLSRGAAEMDAGLVPGARAGGARDRGEPADGDAGGGGAPADAPGGGGDGGRLGPLEVFFSLRKGRATEFLLLFAAIDRGTGVWWEVFAEGLPASHTAFASAPMRSSWHPGAGAGGRLADHGLASAGHIAHRGGNAGRSVRLLARDRPLSTAWTKRAAVAGGGMIGGPGNAAPASRPGKCGDRR